MTLFEHTSRRMTSLGVFSPSWKRHYYDLPNIRSAVCIDRTPPRMPSQSFTAIAQFFRAYPHSITVDVFSRILTPTLNSAKSVNPLVRANSVELFKVIVEKNSTDVILELAVNDLLRLPQASKTAGPDHRVTLYAMLSSIAPSPSLSISIAQTTLPLLAKETYDAAVSLLALAIPPHIIFLLRANESLRSETMDLIAREMNNAKPSIRRAFCSVAGTTLWECGDMKSDASLVFANAVLSSLESNLKNVSASPLNSTSGPLAGYIALAILLGPLSRSGKFSEQIGPSTYHLNSL